MTDAIDVFDEVVLLADARLGTDEADDILRASLLAGAACSRSITRRVPALQAAWTEENRLGAVLLTEFWSAIIAGRLLGAIENRDLVVDELSQILAERIFGSSVTSLRWSLATFEEQLRVATEADLKGEGMEGLDRAMAWFFLYWRSRDLMVGDLPMQGQYRVARNLDAWLADPRHVDLVPPPDREGAVLAREITLWGLETATSHFRSLRATAEGRDSGDENGERTAPPV